ncbi:hypothetical protein R3P38DRAFT_3180139 [Favolaschia claudopus]|uniref:BZIP domain-containing protein n=1 Tax=Favolaschia claudopus TaxID=2862362 RepID=A0AAW0CPA9_9AGAR
MSWDIAGNPFSRLRVSTPESKEKARQRQVKYRKKPDTRQKEASYLTQRRAAVKARRRVTDSRSKSSTHTPKPVSTIAANAPSTSALELLADLATERILEIRAASPSSSYWDSLSSDSRESSRDAALDLPATSPEADPNLFVDEMLPRYCSPATPLQRKTWRLLGQVGPLSGVQRAQLMTLDLALPQEFDDDVPRVQWNRSGRTSERVEMMSSERWKWVRAWRHSHEEYEYTRDWDDEGRRQLSATDEDRLSATDEDRLSATDEDR